MKLSKYGHLTLCVLTGIYLFSSCGSSTPKEGLKVTIDVAHQEAISALAGRPDDPAFNKALDSAGTAFSSDMELVDNFMRYYKALQPDKPLSSLFYSGDTQGFRSEEAFKAHLLTAIHNAEKKMDKVLLERIKAFLHTDPQSVKIKHPASGKTIIYIPGVTNAAELQPVFSNRGGMHFWETYDIESLSTYLVKLNDTLKAEIGRELAQEPVPQTSGTESLQEMVDKGKRQSGEDAPLFSVLQPALDATGASYGATMIGLSMIKDTARVNDILSGQTAKNIFPDDLVWIWGNTPGKQMAGKALALYAVHMPPGGKALVGDDDIASARGDYQNGMPEISIEMNPAGTSKWSRMTRANTGKAIAIELNHFIYSAPRVNSEITGGRSSVTGDFTKKEMDDLVKILNTGSFPLSFKVSAITLYKNEDKH